MPTVPRAAGYAGSGSIATSQLQRNDRSAPVIHQHEIIWDADEKRWQCTRCQRASAYSGRSDAAMEMGQYVCMKEQVGE